ncbi:MAG: LamG domain-containing protein, partial [Planctomycetes bacterium]|nr:LamG domain-containing protein [Planctomycetota bacterium]
LDDMEGYLDSGDDASIAVWGAWVDGFDDPTNGSLVGDDFGGTEKEITHGGSRQSMPFSFDNQSFPKSEATYTFTIGRDRTDWTQAGIKTLTLYVHGHQDNVDGQFYIRINGSSPQRVQGLDLTAEVWQEVNVDLAEFGVNLERVTSMTIGVEGANRTGALFIDDIRLYPSRCIPGTVVGDLTGDCIVDADDIAVITNNWLLGPLAAEFTFESGLLDTSGNMRHGKGRNNPLAQNGVLTLADGSAMDIPLGTDNPFDGTRDFSVAMDFQTNSPGTLLSSARNDMPDNHAMAIYLDRDLDEPFWAEVVYENFRVGNTNAEDDEFFFDPSLWHRLVVTYDAGKEWVLVYLDGVAGEGEEINPAIPNIAADTVRLGATLNTASPNVGGFVGEIDNVRIFNVALTADDVALLPRIPGIPGDVNEDGIVDQQDKDIVEAHMGPLQRWP